MITLLVQVADKTYADLKYFEVLDSSKTLEASFKNKHIAKHLKLRASLDRVLNRTTIMAVQYDEKDPYLARFSLLPA